MGCPNHGVDTWLVLRIHRGIFPIRLIPCFKSVSLPRPSENSDACIVCYVCFQVKGTMPSICCVSSTKTCSQSPWWLHPQQVKIITAQFIFCYWRSRSLIKIFNTFVSSDTFKQLWWHSSAVSSVVFSDKQYRFCQHIFSVKRNSIINSIA